MKTFKQYLESESSLQAFSDDELGGITYKDFQRERDSLINKIDRLISESINNIIDNNESDIDDEKLRETFYKAILNDYSINKLTN